MKSDIILPTFFNFNRVAHFIAIAFLAIACAENGKDASPEQGTTSPLFEEILPAASGIGFQNTVVQRGGENVLNYPYYFNGGGVALGDINNDGLIDVFFTGNQVSNKLYLNKGNFKFEDISDKAGLSAPLGWRTGATMADFNHDGFLDIYVCRSAMADSLLRANQLFLNNGDLTFTEKAGAFGINDKSYSTQAAFFDYDRDNDLDLFVLNHSLPKYAGFNNMLVNNKKRKEPGFHSKLFRNDDGKFHDVSSKAGLISNVLSFGLGLAISDINGDGWPDIYVSNDFNEEDYYYINNHDGTFRESVRDAMGHVSLFSMGSDVADINNDALPDVFTADMLPQSNDRIKLSSGDDNYDKYSILVHAGFHHQTMRNMLQLNNGDGTFSEIGQLAGVSSTDWSWAPFFADFDNDGWKDLYVSNGYEKDYTNMQFLKFTVDEQLKSQQTGKPLDLQQIINQMPAIQVGNVVFRNNGDLTFSNAVNEWGITRSFKSNGAAAADLDNDGDLDLVINTINGPAAVYRNNGERNIKSHYLNVDLAKANAGKIVIGARAYLSANGQQQYLEFSPARGFQSAMYVPLHFGLGDIKRIDSLRLIWPDGRSKLYLNLPVDTTLYPSIADAEQSDGRLAQKAVKSIYRETPGINWKQTPAVMNDFKRQLLLPRMYSYSGPRMATADVNGDKRDDLFICGPKGQAGTLMIQQSDGKFSQSNVQVFVNDQNYQDEDAAFLDADNDGDLDLYVTSGGYMHEGPHELLQDRLYINDGRGNFKRSPTAIPKETLAGGCVATLDVNGDGATDVFVGTRLTPASYPVASPSMLLINDGKGSFRHASAEEAPFLNSLGMVCDATAADINKDGEQDLVIVGEWSSPRVFIKSKGHLQESASFIPSDLGGWWNCLTAADFDGDGDIDLVAGNTGANNLYNASAKTPVTLVYKDFNNDGQIDPFMNYYIGNKSWPYASRDEALGQVSALRQKFPDYTGYSNATLQEIFTPEQLSGSNQLSAMELRTLYLENTGSKFEVRSLPIEAQFAPVYATAALDADEDGDLDLILAGNESNTRVRIGRSDANYGVLLRNDGKGNFTYVHQRESGFHVRGDVRDIATPKGAGKQQVIFGVTDGKVTGYIRN
ncbi:VCBS repeat-containing protein [Chryseolinea sp. T2]|uniref:VCBS repeat-containing protein n=1 Tax=Chryseolinea sp. T2 TaxID=3129255 RepID=UPI0030771F08